MFDNQSRKKNGRFCKKSSSKSPLPKMLDLIRLKKRIAEGSQVIKSEPEVSFELYGTKCMGENNDQSSGPHTMQYNEHQPSEIVLEEPVSAKNCEDFFLIKEIETIKTEKDVEYMVKYEYQSDDYKQDDRNEDFDIRQRRAFRACRAQSKLKETLLEKQERLLDEIIGKQTRQNKQQRTNDKRREEQNDQQKLKKKVSQRKRRENETFEQRANRLMAEKIRKRKLRANETFEQRTKRLLREKIRAQKHRQNETLEQKEQRRLNCKFRKRKRLNCEAFEQREKRLLKKKIRAQKLRQNETVEQKQQRLLNQKLRQRKRIENETSEERQKRLMAGRIKCHRYRKRQQRISAFQDYQRQCRDKVESEVEKLLCVTIHKQECFEE